MAVNLQGQIHHALQRLHYPGHHSRLVNTGQAHIHIQNIRPGILLLQAPFQDISHISFPQGLLKPFFSGGIDPLSNDPDALEFHRLGGGTDPMPICLGPCTGPGLRQTAPQRLDKIRRGAAASPHNGNAQLCRLGHLLRKFLRGNGIGSRGWIRQARIGL